MRKLGFFMDERWLEKIALKHCGIFAKLLLGEIQKANFIELCRCERGGSMAETVCR
jgi:hypothetical protein